jgi:uncharacterized protein (DUF2062 family)
MESPSRFGRCFLAVKRGAIYQAIRLFRVRDASERVARGFAVGMIVNFFPTFGFGVLISGFVARLSGGNAIAGLVGGATLTFFWPLLFYLNIHTGGLVFRPPIPIDDLAEVTDKTVQALEWGKTFMTGAVGNSLIAGFAVYLLLRLVYTRIRPATLAWFRHHARQHRKVRSI